MASLSQQVGLIGDKALQKKLLKLSTGAVKKIMKPAIRAGLAPIRKEAKSNANSQFKDSTIAKMIGSKVTGKGQKVTGKVYIKPDSSGRTITVEGREVPLEVAANIQEFGRKDGSLKAHAYMRPAMDTKKGEAKTLITNKAKQMLHKVTK